MAATPATDGPPGALARPRRVVAAFDFDGTVTDRDTLLPFLLHAFGRARVAAASVALFHHGVVAALRRAPVNGFKVRLVRWLLANQPVEPLRRAGAAHARAIERWLRPAALERIRWHRAQGHVLVLVSASLDLYLAHVAPALGFDHLLCSRPVVRRDGDGIERFDGDLAGGDCAGPEKPRRVEALLGDLAALELHAYGDSAGDHALLAVAKHAHYRPFR